MQPQWSKIKFKQDGVVRKWPRVLGPMQLATNDKTVPICKSTGAFVCLATNVWNVNTSDGNILSQLYWILYASSYNFSAVYKVDAWDMTMCFNNLKWTFTLNIPNEYFELLTYIWQIKAFTLYSYNCLPVQHLELSSIFSNCNMKILRHSGDFLALVMH